MADDPVTKEEADRIAAAKAALGAYPPSVDTATGPSQDMLNQAGADQAAAGDAPLRAKFDSIVSHYTDGAPAAAPAAESPEPGGESWLRKAWNGELPGQQQIQKELPLGGKLGANATAAPGQVANADAAAAGRQNFNPLDAKQAQDAGAALALAPQRSAVIVSPGGMRPSSVTQQVTQGPEVKDGEALLADEFKRSLAGAQGEAAAGLKRDTDLATIGEAQSASDAKLADAEQKAQKNQSEALTGTPEQHGLGGIAGRIDAALKAAAAPVESPIDEIAKMNIGQKIGFALASAGGSYFNRDIYGGPKGNPFLENYNQQIDARVAQQARDHAKLKENAAGQENLFGVMKQGFQSDDAARSALRLMYSQAFKSKLAEAAAHYNIDAANPHLLQMQAQIDAQILANQEELAKISGKHSSKEETDRYVPPSAVVVGGGSIPGLDAKTEAAYRAKIGEAADKAGLGDQRDDLDVMRNLKQTHDANTSAVRDFINHHPELSTANAIAAYTATPEAKQRSVDMAALIKDYASGNGLRSELGRDIVKDLVNPDQIPQLYDRAAHKYQENAARALIHTGIPAPIGFHLLAQMQQDERNVQNATGSPVRPTQAAPLPSALP